MTLTKSNLTKPVDIRKLGAAILEKNHRPLKPEATLEEPGLVNHVLTCVLAPIRVLVLGGKNKKRHRGDVEH